MNLDTARCMSGPVHPSGTGAPRPPRHLIRMKTMLVIQRIKDGAYIRRYEELPGYMHIVYTNDIEKALPMSHEIIERICGMETLGEFTVEIGRAHV